MRSFRITVLALSLPFVLTDPGATQSCPTRVSQSVLNQITLPDVRQAAAVLVIDQAFIDKNGGAQQMMRANAEQIAAFRAAMQSGTDCIESVSVDPASARPTDGGTIGACASYREALRQGIIASEGIQQVLECWARASGQGVPTGLASYTAPTNSWDDHVKASCGKAPGVPPIMRSTDPGAASARREHDAQLEAFSRCVDGVSKARSAINNGSGGTSGLGTGPSTAGRLPSAFGEAANSIGQSLVEGMNAQQQAKAIADAAMQEALGAGRAPGAVGYQPVLGTGGVGAGGNGSTNPEQKQLVDDILDDGPQRMPFPNHYVTSSDVGKTPFRTTISGEFRGAAGGYELEIDVNHDRDSMFDCAIVDVTVSLTIDVRQPDGRSVPMVKDITQTIEVPATAQGAAYRTFPVAFEQRGVVKDAKVTRAAARKCANGGSEKDSATQCPSSLEDKQKWVDARRELMGREQELEAKHKEIVEGLRSMYNEIREVRQATNRVDLQTHLHGLLSLVQFGIGALSPFSWALVAEKMILDVPVKYLVQKYMEGAEVDLTDWLKAITELSKYPVADLILTAAERIKNVQELDESKKIAGDVVDFLDRQIVGLRSRATEIETKLGQVKVEMAKLAALCQ